MMTTLITIGLCLLIIAVVGVMTTWFIQYYDNKEWWRLGISALIWVLVILYPFNPDLTNIVLAIAPLFGMLVYALIKFVIL